jgi:hypothetical protein
MGRWTKRVLSRRAAAITTALTLAPLAVAASPAYANPSVSYSPSAQTLNDCGQGNTLQCDIDALGDINQARAAEGVGPMILPTNYESLSEPQQILVVTNLERTGRGLVPASGLSASLDSIAAAAAAADQDPDPQNFSGNAMASNWAGGISDPLLVDFYWMYDDGYPSPNLDCGAPTDSGCWDHRDNILYPFDAPLAFGAAELNQSGSASVTELFVGGDTATASGAVDALLGATWNSISKSLQPLLSATSVLLNGTTGVGQLRVTASSQQVNMTAKASAGWQVSPASCQLAAGASCELSVTRSAGSTAQSGTLTLSGPAGTSTVSLSAPAPSAPVAAPASPHPGSDVTHKATSSKRKSKRRKPVHHKS